jgi:hypothetical protein
MASHTEDGSDESPRSRSRRSLLTGLIGGLAAFVVQGLAKPGVSRAADGDPVVLGQQNDATAVTTITDSSAGGAGLVGIGTSGLSGISFDSGGYGVSGTAPGSGGYGVYGQSNSGTGVFGSGLGYGGEFFGISGVMGHGSLNGVLGAAGALGATGVFGIGNAFSGATGVWGQASAYGVRGEATLETGAGVLAENAHGGPALQVSGVAKFSRSGLTIVPSGTPKVTVQGVALTVESMIFAVLQQNRAGVWVRAVQPNLAASSFTIYLNNSVPSDTRAAWFVAS